MASILQSLTPEEWFWMGLAGLLIGLAKAGLKGLGMLIVPIMAAVFGGKPSAGLVLPILLIADVFAVVTYNKHADWTIVLKLIPPAIAGVIIALIVGLYVSDETFSLLISAIIIGSLILMVIQEKFGLPDRVVFHGLFSRFFGLLGGFTTMIGNAAGPVMSVYLLSSKLPKKEFIGTGAWFFMVINWIKLPMHIFFWKTITIQSLSLNLMIIPFIALGAFTGFRVVNLIPEKSYRFFVIGITFLIALRLLI